MQNQIKRYPLLRATLWLIILGITIIFLFYFKNILQPFVLSFIIWFLIKSLKDWAGRFEIGGRRMPVWLRSTVAFILILGVLGIITGILIINSKAISDKSEEYSAKIESFFQEMNDVSYFKELTEGAKDGILLDNLQVYLGSFVGSISSLMGDLIFIIVYVIFFLIEESIFPKKIKILIPDAEQREEVKSILGHINQLVNTYLLVKTGASLLTGFLGYWLLIFMGVDFPFLWAFLLFLLNYIPYLGSFIATILPTIFAVFQFGAILPAFYLFLGIEAIQLLVGNFIEPRIVGKTLNLSPLVVIFALAFWGAVWGVLGMILAVPVTSIIVIILSQFPSTRQVAIAVSEDGNLSKISEFD